MSELPKGWATTSFDLVAEVTDFVANGSFAALKENVQYLDDGYAILVRLTDWKKNWQKQFVYVSEQSFRFLSKSTLSPSDIVISCVGEPGQVFQVPDLGRPMTLGPNSVRVRELDAALDKTYFAYYWKSALGQRELAKITTGTTQLKFNKTGLRASNVILPPLPEQKRIADKLDSTLARVETCRVRLDRLPALLKRFRQSILAAATSGRLTEDWRANAGEEYVSVTVAEPYTHTVKAPTSWAKHQLGDICDFVGGSQPPKSTFVETESPDVVRLIQIRDYKSDKYKVFIPRKLARRFCNKTDVMIGRYGPPIFQILRGLEGAYNVALMKAEPTITGLDLEYLFYFLKGDALLRYVEAGSDRTAGQDGVRKELLYPYPVFLPSLPEQHEIVRRVETLFAFADRLEARLATARKQAEQLTPALLAKAFRGELVPQDPNDEPATELLKRLATTRTEAPKAKRGRKAAA